MRRSGFNPGTSAITLGHILSLVVLCMAHVVNVMHVDSVGLFINGLRHRLLLLTVPDHCVGTADRRSTKLSVNVVRPLRLLTLPLLRRVGETAFLDVKSHLLASLGGVVG